MGSNLYIIHTLHTFVICFYHDDGSYAMTKTTYLKSTVCGKVACLCLGNHDMVIASICCE